MFGSAMLNSSTLYFCFFGGRHVPIDHLRLASNFRLLPPLEGQVSIDPAISNKGAKLTRS